MNLKHYNKSITMSNKNIMHYAHSILYFMQKQFLNYTDFIFRYWIACTVNILVNDVLKVNKLFRI